MRCDLTQRNEGYHISLEIRNSWNVSGDCVADLQAPVVKVLLEGLYDKACFFSWFRGHIGGHKIMGLILEHLRRHWESLASSGWSLEEFARYTSRGSLSYS